MAEKTLHSFLDQIEKALFQEHKKETEEGTYGVIQSYKDGVIQIKGLSDLKMGEVVTVQGTHNQALVMNLEKDVAYALVLQSGEGVKEGLFVEAKNQFLQMPVSDGFIGRVVDSLGQPIDGGQDIKSKTLYSLSNRTRAFFNSSALTGLARYSLAPPVRQASRSCSSALLVKATIGTVIQS